MMPIIYVKWKSKWFAVFPGIRVPPTTADEFENPAMADVQSPNDSNGNAIESKRADEQEARDLHKKSAVRSGQVSH